MVTNKTERETYSTLILNWLKAQVDQNVEAPDMKTVELVTVIYNWCIEGWNI